MRAQAPSSGWRLIETTDDLTAQTDHRLILRSDEWAAIPRGPDSATAKRATMVIACGDRLPSSDGRTILFFAGQPMEPFGEELGLPEFWFDNQPRPLKPALTVQSTSEVAFVGTERNLHYSPAVITALLSSTRLTIKYRAFGEDRTVTFHSGGLREALAQLPKCQWPKP